MITLDLDDGRALGLEPVAPHEAMGIAEGCRQLSSIRQWWRMAMAVAAVRSIDGIPLPLPTHEKHIEGMVARFSREELRAISEALASYPGDQTAPEVEMAPLTPLEVLRIWALIGEFESVLGWVQPAFIAASVRKIGNETISLPTTKAEMKALVARLGVAGMAKAAVFMVEDSAAEEAAEADKEAAVKN